ncbi:MAG TPA: hypothetical protein VNA19_12180, partial [Pyrinomonadaceae bacterium]|nr:hypothetical protein [Pyrinomonadaceae bacterium]
MKKLLSILLLTLAASAPATAQTRTTRGNATPARTTTPAAQRQTPAPRTGTAQTPAPSTPPASITTAPVGVAESCGCELPLPEILATVNGVQITRKDLNAETEARVRELQKQVIEARRNELNLTVNSRLLEAEAKKRSVATAKLLEQEV